MFSSDHLCGHNISPEIHPKLSKDTGYPPQASGYDDEDVWVQPCFYDEKLVDG